MAGDLKLLGFLVLLSVLLSSSAAAVRPISDAHRSAALELFAPVNGSFGSLEETYGALRTFQILGVEKNTYISHATCPTILEHFESPSSSLKGLFNAFKVNSILGCQVPDTIFQDISSRLKSVLKNSKSLEDIYHSIGSLLLIKDRGYDIVLPDADGLFHTVKALSQSDGRWRDNSNSAESSTYAAGLALETLAGILRLANSHVDKSMVEIVKSNIVKLFDSIDSYDDGTLYFDEKHVDASEYKGPLATTHSVICGAISFAEVADGKISINGDKILGLAKFFLNMVPGSPMDVYYQIESLSHLESNRLLIPLILSLPATVLSLTSKDQLKVEVTTVFGSAAPPLTVKLVKALRSDSTGPSVIGNQDLKFDSENSIHCLDILPKIDIGKYKFVFEIHLHDPDHLNTYANGGQTEVFAVISGQVIVDKAEINLYSDGSSVESAQRLDLSKDNVLALSANHLQKLHISLQLSTPLGHSFKPHQVLLKLRHETKVEHIFLLESSGRLFKAVIGFLGLVEKFYYLSGSYNIELAVGDVSMENSFERTLGHLELTLPEPPEKAPRPPALPVDPYTRFGPKKEILHVFRTPEKLPSKELSLAFLALTLLPLVGFFVLLIRLRVNLKGFPSSPIHATFGVIFHAGIGAILLLYTLFWLKLNLFTTLKALGVLSILLVAVGHRILSHLASSSTKLKSS